MVRGNNNVCLSAPHGVSQVRLGKLKYKEVGSLASALYLQEKTGSFLIAKTKNNNDDANFDEKCGYRNTLSSVIEKEGICYLIDFHGLSATRDCDVNLGIHLGKNIENNEKVFRQIFDLLQDNGFRVSVDMPFMAGARTVSGAMKNKFPNLWSMQIEVNCNITNREENADKYQLLLKILEQWIRGLL